MEFIFAYGAGLLTLINPCVLPILPIVLAASLQSSRHGPIMLAAGMSLTFVVLGVGVAVFGRSLGITPESVADTGAVMMVIFGVVLLVPRLANSFAAVTAGFSARADARIDEVGNGGLTGHFLGGMLMGAVWSPCIGPTLGGAIALASQGESLVEVTGIMTMFSLGVSTLIVALGYGARSAIMQRQAWLRVVAAKSRPVLGGAFVVVGLGILFRVSRVVEGWAVENLPAWLVDLSVAL